MDTGTDDLRSARVAAPIGELLLVASPRGLVRLHLPGWEPVVPEDPGAHCLPEAAAQVAAYLAGDLQGFSLPLDLVGSGFQRRAWEALLQVPYAATWTYGEIATAMGEDPRTASRAVGTAMHTNPVAVVVPCHRVVGAGGALTGYAGGLAAKRWLLDHEARVAGITLF